MFRMKSLMLLAVLNLIAGVAGAESVAKRWGVSAIGLAGFPVGQKSVRDQARDVGPLLGGMIRYGASEKVSLGVSYENFDAGRGLRVEPILLNGIYHFCTQSKWVPSFLAGVGASRGVDVKNFNHVAAKAGLGLDYFFTPDFALGPQVNYHYVSEKDDSVRHLHSMGVGLAASYFFGGASAPVAPRPAKVERPVSPTPAVALALTPASVTLAAAQTQQFSADVSGTPNKGVTWGISPALGTVTNAGLYTAPATVALAETVTVTATSVADTSRSATALVRLTPPANAAQQVSIELKVLFDTSKDVVKSEYRAEIEKVATFMKSYPSAKAEIEGHTDSMGDDAMNQDLSQRRSNAVRQYLIDQFGVPGDRLTARGYGETKPVSDNKTAEGRAKNRRVIATLTASK